MTFFIRFFLFFSVTSSTVLLASHVTFTPDNTALIFDIDDVVIKEQFLSTFNLISYGIEENPSGCIGYLSALYHVDKKYSKDAEDNEKELFDDQGNKINGATFHLLYHASQDQRLAPHVQGLVKTVEESRYLIEDTTKIIHHLKQVKGYTIMFATNKDRVSYDYVAAHLGQTFKDLTDITFVAQTGNNDAVLNNLEYFAKQESTPDSYKEFLNYALNIQPMGTIHHINDVKPNRSYYFYINRILGPAMHQLFIDDRAKNVDGFVSLDNNTQAQRIGIHFINPAQLATELIRYGILSEQEDQALLDEIQYPGILGKIWFYVRKILASIYYCM